MVAHLNCMLWRNGASIGAKSDIAKHFDRVCEHVVETAALHSKDAMWMIPKHLESMLAQCQNQSKLMNVT